MLDQPTYYPLMLDVRGRKCLVVGGGNIARHKVDGLLTVGARVTVVSPVCLAMPAGVEVCLRAFQPHDLADAWLVIAATDNPQINRKVAEAATARRIWVNVVDDPRHCTAIMPAVLRRGLLCLAVSTAGASPAWARRLRDELAEQYGPEYAEMADLLLEARQQMKTHGDHLTPAMRKCAWETVLDLPVLDLIRDGRMTEARSAILSCLDRLQEEAGAEGAAYTTVEEL